MSDQEQQAQQFQQLQQSVSQPPNGNLKRVSILANVIVGLLAVVAIIIGLLVIVQLHNATVHEACSKRISEYSADLRDNINTAGWAALVSISINRSGNSTDTARIAQQMNEQIAELNGRARDLRNRSAQICDDDPNFQPR